MDLSLEETPPAADKNAETSRPPEVPHSDEPTQLSQLAYEALPVDGGQGSTQEILQFVRVWEPPGCKRRPVFVAYMLDARQRCQAVPSVTPTYTAETLSTETGGGFHIS